MTPPPNKKQTKRRQYNLVYRIRKKGYKINTKERIIFYDGSFLSDKFYIVNKLRYEFNFILQLKINFTNN